MDVALAAIAAAPGLALGSYLNVVASRVPLRMPIGSSRSECMSCASPIAWYDNVPLVSYAVLRGRCRSCSAAISARYPLVEAVAALLVAACVLRFGPTPEAVIAAFFCLVLLVVTAICVEHGEVPGRIVVPGAAIVVVAQTALMPSPRWSVAALAASALLLAGALATRRAVVSGEVALAFMLGAMLGATVAVALVVAVIAAVVDETLSARHTSASPRTRAPVAALLALGGATALLAGGALLDRAQGLIG